MSFLEIISYLEIIGYSIAAIIIVVLIFKRFKTKKKEYLLQNLKESFKCFGSV